jgi:nucleoside phosphorylase
LGNKEIPKPSGTTYHLLLRDLSRKYVVLWDERDKRGWLVNGTSALLHLLRASLECNRKDSLASVFIFKKMEEDGQPYKSDSAIEVLISDANRKLLIYPGPRKSGYTQTTHTEDTASQVTRTTEGVLVEDRIEQLCDVLEKLIDHQVDTTLRNCTGAMSEVCERLEGWDFMDLAEDRDPIQPCMADIPRAKNSWIYLTQSVHAINLFGYGFGEIIQPTDSSHLCKHWKHLPKEQHYLAVLLPDLSAITVPPLDQESNLRTLNRSIKWCSLNGTKAPCQCVRSSDKSRSNPVQVLLPMEHPNVWLSQAPTQQHMYGAVIFGHGRDSSTCSRDLQRGDLPPPNVRSEIFTYDSQSGSTSPITEPRFGITSKRHYHEAFGERSDMQWQFEIPEKRSFKPSKAVKRIARVAGALQGPRPKCREDYTVGWVCALPVELAAAQEMLDEEHDTPRCDAHDTNIYTCGRVGEHNVVIACLPEGQTGTNSAAAVAVQMKSTFSSMRFGLMVGIGGGVPGEEADVRLGDVVVSKPHKTHGGVVQYDSGKATPSGFERTGALNTPPTVLLNAVANLRAKQMRGKGKLLEYLSKLDSLPDFTREAAGLDALYDATYDHKGGATCKLCDVSYLVAQESRRQNVVVHHGTIASGNQVMRNAAERDRVSAELGGVLCFEMEAAGLMNSFPCLVVRGICDYADSHKNERWQPYAAATAAAYAKEVLSAIPPAEVAASRTAEESIREASG